MKWQRMAFRPPGSDVPEGSVARHTTRSAPNFFCKQPQEMCSKFYTLMETVLVIIFAAFTTSLLISAGCPGPSSQNEHGAKSEAKVKERSRQKNTEPSSLRRKTPSAALTQRTRAPNACKKFKLFSLIRELALATAHCRRAREEQLRKIP